MSWAKVYAVLAMLVVAIVGVLQLILLSSLSSIITSAGGAQVQGLGASVAGLGVIGLVIMIPVAGVVAFLVGFIGAFLLNLVLKWVGG